MHVFSSNNCRGCAYLQANVSGLTAYSNNFALCVYDDSNDLVDTDLSLTFGLGKNSETLKDCRSIVKRLCHAHFSNFSSAGKPDSGRLV